MKLLSVYAIININKIPICVLTVHVKAGDRARILTCFDLCAAPRMAPGKKPAYEGLPFWKPVI
jgi:hypothetical protein